MARFDILGVDKKTLKYYVKATEERKKKATKRRTGLFWAYLLGISRAYIGVGAVYVNAYTKLPV
jgi:hypothetical protein